MKKSLFMVFVLSLSALGSARDASAAYNINYIDAEAYLECASAADGNVEALANEAICLVAEMSPYFDLGQQARYLVPIKKAAGSLKATSYARGNLSATLRKRLVTLSSALGQARGFVEKNMEVSAVFDLMVDVLALEEKLNAQME